MKVLITGGAGFIGSHIADRLVGEGHEVTCFDDLSTGLLPNIPLRAKYIHGDVRNGVPQDRWDVIYHCAASYKDRFDWERDASVNVLGTINVVREVIKSGAKLVYFQTSLCYGPRPMTPVKTDDHLDPVGSYAVSKTAAEMYIRDSGVPFVSLRLANIYGPRNLSGPVPTFFKRLSEGQTCTVVDSRRDFLFVSDLVDVAIRIKDDGLGVYHVSSGNDYSILELYLTVAEAMGIEVEDPELTPRGPDDVATILLDPWETYTDFGWKPRVHLGDGIRQAVDWYLDNGVEKTFTHLSMKG